VNDCPRPLDPIDAEALASGEEPVLAADAGAHAASCAPCAATVGRAKTLLAQLEALAADRPSGPGPDLASRVIRIRPFSSRERRDLRLWAGPAGFGVLLVAAGFAALAAPGLTAADQAGLQLAALAPWNGLIRAALRALSDAASAAPAGWQALSDAARTQAPLGLVALLLLAPAGFALRRLLAATARR
jgi:hypothetical protein